MPYIGKSPEHGNFAELNDVSGSFNGSTTQFALTTRIGGIAITPVVEAALLISLDGVIQEPTTDYTVSGTNITFTTAPASTVSFFGVVMGRQLDVGTPSDATVTSAKLASTFMTGATDIGGAIADADLFIIDDGAGGTLRKTAASRIKTYIGTDFSDPSSADGDTLGSASAEWSDLYLADGGVIYFGNDQDVTVTHDPDDGLFLKSTATADDNPFVLTLQTGETDIAANDVIGQIDFQAPDEGTGTDAILVAAGIAAVSEGDFSSSSNATKLSFKTGASEAASEKMSLSSAGILTIADDLIIGDGKTIGSSSDVDAMTIAADGVVTFSQVPVLPNNTVETADIQDNAVTLAKMAGLARGKIIYGDSSGDPAALALGTSGQALVSDGTDISWGAGGPSQANQAALEAQTNQDTYAPPDLMHHHPGMGKCWCAMNGTGTVAIRKGHGMSSLTDHGTGDYTMTFSVTFSSVEFCGVLGDSGRDAVVAAATSHFDHDGTNQEFATTSAQIFVENTSFANVDSVYVSAAFFGDF